MPLPIDQIEYFFDAKFDPPYSTPHEIRELKCFDGFAHWRVWLDEQKQHLHFSADKDDWFSTFPTFEIGVFCADVYLGTIPDIGTILTIKPQSEANCHRDLVGITKTLEGRLSFCTNIGELMSDG